MEFEIVELEEFSGSEAAIYSVVVDDSDNTLFDYFIEENSEEYANELKSIITRLEVINEIEGARKGYFKMDEGKPGDGVSALYDDPDSKLRLYCIRYGMVAVLLGGGGPKPKNVRAWQDDKKLTLEATTLIEISKRITNRMKEGDLQLSANGKLIGNLKFTDDEN